MQHGLHFFAIMAVGEFNSVLTKDWLLLLSILPTVYGHVKGANHQAQSSRNPLNMCGYSMRTALTKITS